GTDEQQIEYHTVDVDHPAEIKVSLQQGRRTDLAAVPPPVAPGHPEREKASDNMGKALERLRAFADPLYRNDMIGRVGGVGAAGSKSDAVYDMAHMAMSSGKLVYETKIESGDRLGVELLSKVEVVPGS